MQTNRLTVVAIMDNTNLHAHHKVLHFLTGNVWHVCWLRLSGEVTSSTGSCRDVDIVTDADLH